MADSSDRRSRRPAWIQPASAFRTGLKVRNSLTEALDEFIPNEGKLIRWYICGPTVYDSSHLGHARSYLTFDIIRRILEDYFGYNLFVCMNITDIDDKIILRARRNYLYAEYALAHPTLTAEVVKDIQEAVAFYITGLEKKLAGYTDDLAKNRGNATEIKAEIGLASEKLAKAKDLQAKVGQIQPSGTSSTESLELVKDQLAELEDVRKGGTLDQGLMKKLTSDHSLKFEKEYLEDMRLLNIRTPDVLTRVSEYVPEIMSMTQKIIDNGYGYDSEGSVYFDTVAFDKKGDHFYAKLKPNAVGDLKQLAEGEGALSAATAEKRSKNDFALWKKSKRGEPAWESKWGMGRPGWHIECSAMAGDVLGPVLDIHAGGEDLKFPHHDNELAQSEAFFDSKQWVNYFLHAGHLHIDGLKMSKSLKNFITIRQALDTCTPRQLRLLFLLQNWDSVMNYQRKDTLVEVNTKEKALSEFFQKVDAALAERKQDPSRPENWNAKDVELNKKLLQAEQAVHSALQNNFDTPSAIGSLMKLVSDANTYISGNTARKAFLLKKVAVFVTKILRVFGVIEGNQEYGLGSESGAASGSLSEIAGPYVQSLVKFRSDVRTAAKDKAEPVVYLKLTDTLRDDVMPELGVKIRDDDPAFPFMFVDKATIAKEKEDRIKTQLAATQKKLDELTASAVTPAARVAEDFNVLLTTEPTKPEEVPDKTTDGKEVNKKQKTVIVKKYADQKKKRATFEAQLAKNPQLVINLETQVATLKQQLAALAK